MYLSVNNCTASLWVENGGVTTQPTVTDTFQVVTVECNPGFTLTPDQAVFEVLCDSNSTWVNKPVCMGKGEIILT